MNLKERADKVLADAEADIRQARQAADEARAIDGPSFGSSLLAMPVYVAPDVPKRCDVCGRGPAFYDGCSIVACPNRPAITACVAASAGWTA